MSKEVKAFDYPTEKANSSSKSPIDQVNDNMQKDSFKNLALINLTEGKSLFNVNDFNHYGGYKNISQYNIQMKKYRQKGCGRTINVPKTHPTNSVPGPSFNGAVTIGETCIGTHCAMPVEPTATNMINNNLNSANPPPGANVHYPGTDRLGNSSLLMPAINDYVGTKLNHGPHRIQCAGGKNNLIGDLASYFYIVNPESGRKVNIYGKIGKKVLMNYLNLINK